MKAKVAIPLLFIACSIGLWIGQWYGSSSKGLRSEEPYTASSHTVSTYKVKTSLVPDKIILSGEIVAARRIQLAPRSSGRLIEVSVGLGDRVDTNGELARLDAPELKQALLHAQADLRNAQSEQKDANADLEHLTTLARKQLASEDALRDARTRLERARAVVNATETEVRTSKADLDELILRAPEALVVVRRLREPGDLAGPSLPVVEAESTSKLRFDAWVPLSDSHRLQTGMSVEIRVEGDASPLVGHLSRIASSADSITRSRKIEIILPEVRKPISGQYGEAHITVGEIALPTLPVSTLINRAGITGVFVVDDDGKARYRSVRTGRHVDGQVEVLAGVTLGERVVDTPTNDLIDGVLVEIASP